MFVSRWLRRGAPLDEWWQRSARHRVVFGVGAFAAFSFVAALLGGDGIGSALAEGLIGGALMLLALLGVVGRRLLRGRRPLA